MQRLVATLFALLASAALLAAGPAHHAQWEPDIRQFEAHDRASAPPPGAILFVGSSSIRMWGTLAHDFPSLSVLNRGFGGSQIADVTHYVDRIVTPYRPKMVLLYAGDNDIAAGGSPDEVVADFDVFVKRVRQDLPDVPIAFISIKPSIARASLQDNMRAANEKIARYAAAQKDVKYIDVFTPMLGADGKPRAGLFLDDGLHLNRAGYELWRDVIGRSLR